MMKQTTPKKPDNSVEFVSAARALCYFESEERFNGALAKIARVKPKPDVPNKIEEPKTDKPAK